MFNNYLKVSYRSISRHKGYSFINVMGLAVGMTCCILILLWIQEELSFDRFHQNSGNLYRLVEELKWSDGRTEFYGVAPAPLAPALKEEFPEIAEATRFLPGRRVLVSSQTKKFYGQKIAQADSAFLMMFTFPLIQGDPRTALLDPASILLTEEIAEKYFGRKNPMGKNLEIENNGIYQVKGILKNIPANSHLQFDFLIPFNPDRRIGIPESEVMLYYTYILLEPESSLRQVNLKIKDSFKKFAFSPIPVKLSLQPLKRIHLYSRFDVDMEGHGNITHIIIFSMIAGLVLLLACINFINLSTAQYSRRAKEVSLRKVVGAKRIDIIKQFYGEALMMSFLAAISAVLLSELFLPIFNEVSGKELTMNFTDNIYLGIGLLGITLITGVVSGHYPAWVLSAFQPANGLKGQLNLSRSSRSRRILVVIQFSISTTLLLSTIIVSRQADYMRNKRVGFDKEQVVYIPIRDSFRQNLASLKSELKAYPGIESLTTVSELPTHIVRTTDALDWPGKRPEENILMNLMSVDDSSLDTFRFEISEGRFFSDTFPADPTESFVVNEAAVQAMGLVKPVGKPFQVWGTKGKIIGVIKNFHFRSMHHAIGPLIMRIQSDWSNYLCVRMKGGYIPDTLRLLENRWNRYSSKFPFEYHFLDSTFDHMYAVEYRTASIINYFSFLAIFISCLGLFGLSSFITAQRSKEIGIRKVLGATTFEVVTLLSQEFTRLVLVANCFAWPLAFYALGRWLQNFAYRINLGPLPFILAGGITLGIALVTVGYQSVKAAMANPVKALHSE